MSFLYSGSLWSSLYCGVSSLCVGLYSCQATNLKSSVNPKDNKYWECQNPSTEHIIVKLLKIKDKKKFCLWHPLSKSPHQNYSSNWLPPEKQSYLLVNEGQSLCYLSGFFNLHTCSLGVTEFYVLDLITQVSNVLVMPCLSQFKYEDVFIND